jgi:RNA polymerase sigma-70 factor (ECF subfamily)
VRVEASEQERFTRHWTQAQPAIAGYIAAVVGDPHQADDLVQEVAVVLLRKFLDYDERRPFVAWAMGMAKTAILSWRRDQGRSQRRFAEATIEALGASWEAMLPELDERRAALHGCVERLQGRGRELLALRYEQELAPQAIADRLGLSAVAVRVALTRLRSALQSCVERRLGGSA